MGRKDCCKGSCGTTFEAKRWMAMDPGGMIGASSSALLHLYALVVIITHLLKDSSLGKLIFICLYLPTVLMALLSLYMAWSTDPGAVPLGARPLVKPQENKQTLERVTDTHLDIPLSSHLSANLGVGFNLPHKSVRRCHKCEDNYKPPRAHHDSVTGRCIVKMDHFCPWVGNVVGILNHKFFILFIFYTCLSAMMASILIINRVIYCANEAGEDSPQKSESCQHLFTPYLFMLGFETVLFFSFTVCMLFEQIETIKSGTSKIARMKRRQGADVNESPVIGEVNEMFGGTSPGLSWHWFVPSPVVFPPLYKDEIMGYEYHSSWQGEIYMEEGNHELDPEDVVESGQNTKDNIDLYDGNSKDITVKKRPSSRLEMEDESSLI